MSIFTRQITSIRWRYRLWRWGRRLRIANKIILRDRRLISPYVAKLIALGRYEKPERDLLLLMRSIGLIGGTDRVIEGGGGLGTITMALADIVGDDRVFVYEPNPRTADALSKNLIENGHRVNLTVAALSASTGDTIKFRDQIDDKNSFAMSRISNDPLSEKSIDVRSINLSTEIDRVDPTILVIDVEGYEKKLLLSIDNWNNIHSIHLEIHRDILTQNDIEELEGYLNEAGFFRVNYLDEDNMWLFTRVRPDSCHPWHGKLL